MGRRLVFSFALPLLAGFALAGCAAPPVVSLATSVVTGASYILTGKGPGDHLLSLATGRECDALRAFRDKPFSPICRRPAPPVALAAAQPAPRPGPGLAFASVDDDGGADLAALGRALAAVAPAAGGARPDPASPEPPGSAGPLPADPEQALPDDVIAGLRAALDRNAETAAEAALAARIAGAAETRIAAAERQRAGRVLAAAVVAAIARHPDRAGGILRAAVAAAPESRVAIVAGARAAFPGFAATIDRAANAPTPAALAAALDSVRSPASSSPARERPSPRPRRPFAGAASSAPTPPA